MTGTPTRAAASATPTTTLPCSDCQSKRALTREHEVGTCDEVREADRLEHGLDTCDPVPAQQVQGIPETTRRPGAGFALRLWSVPVSRSLAGGLTRATTLAKWPRAFSRALRLLRRRALLLGEDGARPLEAEQRRVDITRDDEVGAA